MGKKSALYVNGKYFPTIKSAASFLMMPMTTLADRLKRKKATVYKDVFIERVNKEEKENRNLGHSRLPVPVIVDGVRYTSCCEASRAVGLSNSMINYALRNNIRLYKGHVVEPVKENEINHLPFPSFDELVPNKPKINQDKFVFGDYPVVIQNLIEEHVKDLLKKGTPFDEVKKFLLESGCKKITINLMEDKDAE